MLILKKYIHYIIYDKKLYNELMLYINKLILPSQIIYLVTIYFKF